MPEKLLLTGRAGSGKTGAILDRLRRAILDGRSTEVLLILPTQSQVDHLRGVLLRDGVPAFRDDFAHTFFTLARSFARVLPEQLLSEEGKGYLLGEVLRLESDRMGYLQACLNQTSLDKQRGIVENEKRLRGGAPYAGAFDAPENQTFTAPHPYNWPVIGSALTSSLWKGSARRRSRPSTRSGTGRRGIRCLSRRWTSLPYARR